MVRPCGARSFIDLADAILHQCEVANAHRHYGKVAVPNYVISKTNGVSDILEVGLLLKEAGLLRPRERELDVNIVPASSLLRGSPSLSGASVLSASRLEPLAPFPLPSPARFSRSIRKPGRASRCLHAGCRSVGIRTSSELIPEGGSTPGFDIT
jgi:Phosphoenolpyruvate carboxylase